MGYARQSKLPCDPQAAEELIYKLCDSAEQIMPLH